MKREVLCTAEVLLIRSLLYYAVDTDNKEMFNAIHNGEYKAVVENDKKDRKEVCT